MIVLLVRLAGGYLAVGLLFAVWFAARGAGRLDPVARHGTAGFRVLVVPGAVLLWPWLAWEIGRGRPAPPVERTAHRQAAVGSR